MARRKQPQPAASSPARPSSKAKDYTTHREYQVQDELDELRNRGVAKFMNRHFTATSKQLAKEKAEADAALADLERRRAQTSKFVPSNSGDLHPFDSLYVELQQKRADCRRKERETMLLYQRYVHKFQKSRASGPSKSPEKKATPPVQEVDEEISDDELELFVHQTPQKGDNINVSIDETSTPEAAAPPPSSPPSPPLQDPPGVSPTHKSPSHEQEVVETVEEKKMPDPPDLKSKPSTVPEDKSVEQEEAALKEKPEPEPQQEEPQEVSPPAVDTSMEIDCNDAVEAEPSATEPMDAPALVEEAPEEEQTAATVVTPVLNSISSESFSVNRPTAEVTADFPPATASEEDTDEDDQRSVISGLTTVNSALTRQVMEQLESEMEFFIKNETEAIQKLLDEEEGGGGASVAMSFGGSRLSSDASVTCDKSVRASIKAEQMAEEMQKMLEQFEKDEMSATEESKSSGEEMKKESSSITHSLYPRKYKSPNPNEEWMIYWDEKYEREYFYEKKSKTTQWEAPVMKLGFKDNPDFVPQAMPKRTSRLIVEKRLSRSDIYKKKLRKRRMQRAAIMFIILGSLLLSALHWQMNHAEKSYADAMKATYIDLKDVYEYSFTNRTAEEQEAAEIARRQEEARKVAELERKRKEAEVAAEAERLRLEQKRAQEEAERKRKAAAEEAEKKRRLEAEKKAAKEKAAREKRLREEEKARVRAAEEARQKKQEEERKAEVARLEEERLAKLEEEMRRPWGCNLPFSHVVHRRCGKLAKINPIYSEEDLLNSFLQ